jgi:hypothetical protein
MEEENVNLQPEPVAPQPGQKVAQTEEAVMPAKDEAFFNDIYSDFWNKGYHGDKNDFFQLICSNDEALTDAYEIAVSEGYKGTIDQFKSHVGVTEGLEKKSQVENEQSGIGPLKKEDTIFNVGYEPGVDPNELSKQHEQEKLDKAWEGFTEYVDRKAEEDGRDKPEPRDQGDLRPITRDQEAYRISAGDKKARADRKDRLIRVAKGEEKISVEDSMLTSMANMTNQIVGTVPYADWLYAIVNRELDDLGITREVGEITTGGSTDPEAYFAEADAKVQKMKSFLGPTLGFTDMTTMKVPLFIGGSLQMVSLPEATLDNSGKFIAGAFNSLTSVLGSVVQARLTFGVGLFTDMMARSIEGYNQSKAEDLGITTQELYKNKQQEILPGTIVGALAYGLEKIGMDEVLGSVIAKGSGVASKFVQKVIASGVEGGTEYFQAILEKANELLAKRNPGDVGKIIGDFMFSKQAFEALLQGAFGGYGAKSLALGFGVTAAVKTEEQSKKQDELIEVVASIEDQLTKPSFSTEEKIILKETRNSYVEEIREINKAVDEITENIPKEQGDKIKALYEKQIETNGKIPKILSSKNLTEEQKTQAIDGLQKKFNQYQEQINGLVEKYGNVGNVIASEQFKVKSEFVSEKGEVKETPQAPYIADGVDLSDNTRLQDYKKSLNSVIDADKLELVESVERVKNALSKVASELGIVIHETNNSFEKAIPEAAKSKFGAKGALDVNGILHINLEKADKSTAAHEAFHVLLKKAFGTDSSKYKTSLKDMLSAIKPDLSPNLQEKLEQFVEQYDENIQNEEMLSELFGIMAATESKFTPTTRQKIKRWVNNTANTLGIQDLYTDKDIQDLNIKELFNTLSGKVSKGKEITTAEVLSLNTENLAKFSKGEDIEQGQDLGSIVISGKNDKPSGKKIDLQLVSRLGVDIDKIRRGTMSDLDGARAFIFAADKAVTGRTLSPTGVEHDFMGGFLYPYLNQGAWAFTDEINANKALNRAKETDGVGLVMSQASSGILGSQSFQEYAFKEVFNAVNNGADVNFIVDRLNEVLESSYKKGKSYSDYLQSKGFSGRVNNINDLTKLFPYSGEKATNYESRNGFYSKLFNAGMEKETGIPRFDFGKDVKNRNSLHGVTMSEIVNDPALSKVGYGEIVSAIQFDKNSKIIDTRETTGFKTHPSYPFILEGTPIMVFNESYDVRKIAPNFVPASETANQTPLGERSKNTAARAAMGGQPTTKITEIVSEKSPVLLQKATEGEVKAFDALYEKGNKKASEMIKPKSEKLGEAWRRVGRTFNRQREIDNFLNEEGSKESLRAFNVMKTSQGANGAASAQFNEYSEKAFKGLKRIDEDDLNKVRELRRVISINKERSALGQTRYERVSVDKNGKEIRIDGNVAQNLLNSLKERVGENKYKELDERTTAIFQGFSNNLKDQYDSGRIDEETYLRFKDVEYSPMLAIQNIIQDNEGLYDEQTFDHIMLKYGLGKQDIKSLTDQNSKEIINDSRWLLRMHTAVTQTKVFNNKMLSAFNEAYENNKEGFEGLVYDNPVVGKVKVGETRASTEKASEPVYRLKYKHESDLDKNRPKNTSVLKFYDKGKPKFIVMDTEMARQMFDIKPENYIKAMSLIDQWKLDWITGSKTLRYMATIGNPMFVLPAAPMDFSNIILNNRIYSAFIPKAAVELGTDALVIAARKMRSDLTEFTDILGTSKSFDKIYKEFALHGGSMDYLSREGIQDLQKRKEYGKLLSTGSKVALKLGQALSYAGQTSELTFRLAAFQKQKSNLVKAYKKANTVNPVGQDYEDILHSAALAARNTINFSEGGNTIKLIDKVSPYLNAAFQGSRKVGQALDPRKKTGEINANDLTITLGKYAQVAALSAAIPTLSWMILSGLVGGDEEEAKKLIKKFKEDTGDWEKTQYTLIPTSLSEDGNINYIRIRRNPATAPIATLGTEWGYKFLNKHGLDFEIDGKTMADSFEKAMPISIDQLDSRIPLISALMTYVGNKDTFFDSKIYLGPDNVLPEFEGLQSDRVNNIYKILAKGGSQLGLGISPIRSQAAVEKVFTNPRTNLIMSMVYGLGNVIPTEWNSRTTTIESFVKGVASDASLKLMRTTNPNIKSYELANNRKIDLLRSSSDLYNNEQKAYSMIKKMYKEGSLKGVKTLPIEVRDFIKETFPKQMTPTYLRKYTRYMQNKELGINQIYYDIAFEFKPELKARLIYQWYGADMDSEEKREVVFKIKKLGGSVSGRTWSLYNDLSKGDLE